MKSFKNFTETKSSKEVSLDDLNPVEYPAPPGEVSRRHAKRRKVVEHSHKHIPKDNEIVEGLDFTNLDEDEKWELFEFTQTLYTSGFYQLDEILNVAQRRKRGIIAKRNKAKLKRGRIKASKRIADRGRIERRARRQAKNDLVKKMTKGVSKSDLSPQRKAEIERRLSKMGGRVDRLQKRVLPSVRKRDRGL